MLATGRYLYVIFLCHLALEKILKAHVTEVTQTIPANTHDLIYLVKKCGFELPESYLDFVGKINTACLGIVGLEFWRTGRNGAGFRATEESCLQLAQSIPLVALRPAKKEMVR